MNNYRAAFDSAPTRPLCQEDIETLIERMFRKPAPAPHTGPKVDLAKLMEHGIPFHMEYDDLVLVSSEGMRRAQEVGAIVKSPI